MKESGDKTKIFVSEEGRNELEKLIDLLADDLMINDTYYGNILSGIHAFFSLLIENQPNTQLEILYSTEYQNVSIFFHRVSRETIQLLSDLNQTKESSDDNLFLLHKLTEKIIMNDDSVTLVFSIGGLHQKLFERRSALLKLYFEGKLEKLSIKND